MKIGMVGLGKMGLNMSRRLIGGGHEVVGSDPAEGPRQELGEAGGRGVGSIAELVAALEAPRAVWVMVPAGKVTEHVLGELATALAPGDVVIDGGNSFYRDSVRHGAMLAEKKIDFVDAGTSGGIWGLEIGYCLMVGGAKEAVGRVAPALTTLAPTDGWLHVGPIGSGHFVKMVHNGIEYGMLQAYAEGFEILRAGDYDVDLGAVADLWNHGSVVRSWLLELAERAFRKNGNGLDDVRGWVADSGEGRWTLDEAIERAVPAPVLAASLFARFASRQQESYAAKVIAALRGEFGGHEVKSK